MATGEVGEVAVRGPNVMVGYWNKPAQTADVLVDGWYRSGDLGYQDARGFLYLVDPAKDMIVSGGESLAAVGDGGRFVRAKGAGHNMFDVDPELVQETINDVLNDTN